MSAFICQVCCLLVLLNSVPVSWLKFPEGQEEAIKISDEMSMQPLWRRSLEMPWSSDVLYLW